MGQPAGRRPTAEEKALMQGVMAEFSDVLDKHIARHPDNAKIAVSALANFSEKIIRTALGSDTEMAMYYYALADDYATKPKDQIPIPKFKNPGRS